VPFEVLIERSGRWRELTPEIREELTSGSVYRFRFEADGFFPEEYALEVERFQTELSVEAEMVPYPAAVELRGDTAGVELRIDGSRRYLRGGRDGGIEQAPVLTAEPRELLLTPGEHRLTFTRGSASSSVTTELRPRERTTFELSYDDEEEALAVQTSDRRIDPDLGREAAAGEEDE
jgi:serine/threonine-protein kinase